MTVTGLQAESGQGDRAILEDLQRFGAEVEQNADAVTVRPAPLHGCSLDVRGTPDLAPPLALLAACAAGTTRITGAARLRYRKATGSRASPPHCALSVQTCGICRTGWRSQAAG